ncbi:hypothetical protein EBR44_15185, partial [bacterium]|nr:hypothetical protein [bacterium]
MNRRSIAAIALLLPAAVADAGQGFGSIFFYTLETGADGQSRVEWVGSAMIWLLLAMSLANVVLIALSTAGNARKGVLPEHALGDV